MIKWQKEFDCISKTTLGTIKWTFETLEKVLVRTVSYIINELITCGFNFAFRCEIFTTGSVMKRKFLGLVSLISGLGYLFWKTRSKFPNEILDPEYVVSHCFWPCTCCPFFYDFGLSPTIAHG